MNWIVSRLEATRPNEKRLRALLVVAHESLRRRVAEDSRLDDATPSGPLAEVVGSRFEDIPDYAELVERVRATIETELPDGARVLVVSRGDPELLRLRGRTGGHFPQTKSGEWAGFYPAVGEAVVEHLERVIGLGYEFLVFPSCARWWLEYYAELAHFLDVSARLVHHASACTIFDLRSNRAREVAA
jgi:hypothetical protein